MRFLPQRLAENFARPPVVTVLRLAGPIGMAGPFGRGLDDVSLAPVIERAFKPKRLAAVALAINSPGGSPAQSALIAGRIRDAAEKKGVPVLAFVEDVAASGGYWLACAADEIWALETSILGSIGVISAGFGFHEALSRYGVERRVHTAGTRKAMLDPFQPEQAEDVARLEALQRDLHLTFIDYVKGSRAGRLAEDGSDLFSGEFWLGGEAKRLGLADGIGRLGPVIREKFGETARIVATPPKRGMLRRLGIGAQAGGAESHLGERIAGAAAASALAAVEERALWARYGL